MSSSDPFSGESSSNSRDNAKKWGQDGHKQPIGNKLGSKGIKKKASASDTALLKTASRFRGLKQSLQSITTQTGSTLSMVTQEKRAIRLSKWSRKLYGSDKAVMEERLKIFLADRFIIHPYSDFRMAWDFLTAVVIIMNLIVIPMDIAFSGSKDDLPLMIFKLVSDIWFVTDIALNFRTGVAVMDGDKTKIELNSKKITIHYLKTWFFIDLVASSPVDLFANLFSGGHKPQAFAILRMGKILSLLRIGRLPRLVRSLHHWEEIFNLQYDFAVSMIRLTYLIFIIMLICHWNGCLQYAVPRYNGFPADTWVALRGLHGDNVTWFEMYSWSLFKSTSQMLCIGYSHIIPQGMIDLWMTMYSQITGAIIFAVFIGNAINLMEGMDATKNEYAAKIGQIQEYLSFRRIPVKMKRRILDYFELRYLGKLFDEKKILRDLSPVLRRDVIWHNTAHLVQSVPVFENCDEEFVYAIGEKLTYTVFMTGDEIVREGDKAFHVFFISQGDVEARSKDGETKRSFSDGAHFGEACLFKAGLKRSTSVFSLSTSHLYTLHHKDYSEVLQRYPCNEERIMTSFNKIRDRSDRYEFIKRYNKNFYDQES